MIFRPGSGVGVKGLGFGFKIWDSRFIWVVVKIMVPFGSLL